MASKKTSHRPQALGIGLSVVTWVFAVGVVFAAGSFAWRELAASEQLRAILNGTPSDSETSTRPDSLRAWRESHTSKKDTEAWGRVLNEVSGPFATSQMATLLMGPSDDPVDWGQRIRGQSLETNVRIRNWLMYPDALSRFLETARPLLTQIHSLCKDRSPVYLPIAARGEVTLLFDHQGLSEVCKLLFLECAVAAHRKDTKRLLEILDSLDAIHEKFSLPANPFRSIALASALHLALDADILDETQLREWIMKLKNRSDWLQNHVSLDAAPRHTVKELVRKFEKSSFLDGADGLPSQILMHSNGTRVDGWIVQQFLIEQDHDQSALVRMALTLMALEQFDAPKSLENIPSNLLQARDWTNLQGVPLEYDFDASRGVGILKPKRPTVDYHSDIPLPDTYEIDFSDRKSKP